MEEIRKREENKGGEHKAQTPGQGGQPGQGGRQEEQGGQRGGQGQDQGKPRPTPGEQTTRR